jgi:hypothetical protein
VALVEIAGHKIPKWALIGGAGVVVAGGLYAFKHGSSSSSSSGSTADTVTDPSTGQTYSATAVDSLTGQTYASEIAEYGSVSAAESAVAGQQAAQYGYAGGASDTGTTSTDTGTTSTTPTANTVTDPTTGAIYSATAVDPVTGQTYAAEIATYGSVAAAEAQLAAPTSTAPPTGTAPPKPTNGAGTSYQFPAPTGLKVTAVGSTSVSIAWNKVAAVSGHSPTGYTVAVYQTNGVSPYQQVWQGTSGTIGGLHPSWQYHVNVWANGGPVAPSHATATFTTTK